MKCNMGTTDRMIRIAISIILVALALTTNLSNAIKIALFVISIALAITSITGFCLLYVPFKFDSRRIDPLERRR